MNLSAMADHFYDRSRGITATRATRSQRVYYSAWRRACRIRWRIEPQNATITHLRREQRRAAENLQRYFAQEARIKETA